MKTITNATMNQPVRPGGFLTKAEDIIMDLRPGESPKDRELLSGILMMRPCLIYARNVRLLDDIVKFRMLLEHGYQFRMFITEYAKYLHDKKKYYEIVRLTLENGGRCPYHSYPYVWIYDLAMEVSKRSTHCKQAVIALGGIRRRRKDMRDILSFIMPMVWSTRCNDKWLDSRL